MRRVVAILVCCVALTSGALAARAPDLNSKELILGWINNYRSKPDPARVPTVVRELARLGLISDSESSGVYVGFLAGVLASNPAKAEQLIAKMVPLRPEYQWIIVRAIAYSSLPEWKALLKRASERMPARRVMIDRFLNDKLPTLQHAAQLEKDATFGDKLRDQFTLGKYFKKKSEEVGLEITPDLLDTLWGYYYATGSYNPIRHIIVMLRWSKERDSIEKLTVGSMAKYTLAINASRNADLLAMIKWSASQQHPEAVGPILKQVIEAAETTETGRLRNEALAAIDELKRKGPGSKRDLSMWGQVGEGALALGCIAAAVAGQVAFGIPCVVGGAATSTALRLWGN